MYNVIFFIPIYLKIKKLILCFYRLYELDPRYPFRNELEALLRKVYSYIARETKDKYYIKRTRPRKPGKPFSITV